MIKEIFKKFFGKKIKLHIGCGTLYKDGWVNIDNNSDNNIEKLDINHDLSTGLPFEDNQVDFIYHEHFIEHLTYDDGLLFLKDCFRVLKPSGVMRVACPDLDQLIQAYVQDNWRELDWVSKYNCQWIESRGRMLNANMNIKPWGHQYLYNKEDLCRRLTQADFSTNKIIEASYAKSKFVELCNLDTRADSMFFDVQK